LILQTKLAKYAKLYSFNRLILYLSLGAQWNRKTKWNADRSISECRKTIDQMLKSVKNVHYSLGFL